MNGEDTQNKIANVLHFDPTPEQEKIIKHDLNKHATVLAVAGSGKTKTMVYRIQYLIMNGVPHNSIRAVMYNKSAQQDFENKLKEIGIANVKVQTFHSLGNNILNWAAKEGYCQHKTLTEDAGRIIKESIKLLRKDGIIDRDEIIDEEEALNAISTWKSMLTLPYEAKHLEKKYFVDVYRKFEELRNKQNLITFDDQIFDAVLLLESNNKVHERLANHLLHIIIDEFQDVNLARLKLAKIIAGERARVMVVGDDDQCIYEWQGARSSYIKRGFTLEFTKYPHTTYKLSKSFRFGPAIAQISANVIRHNSDRVEKDLVAHNLNKESYILLNDRINGDAERSIPSIIRNLVENRVDYNNMVLLVRKYSQSHSAQLLMIMNNIPFYVDGNNTFINGFAVNLALNYIDLAINANNEMNEKIAKILVENINRPVRYVKQLPFEAYVNAAVEQGKTLLELLDDQIDLLSYGLTDNAVINLQLLARSLKKISSPNNMKNAGVLLSTILAEIDMKTAFEAFQNDWKADEEIERVKMLASLFSSANIPPNCAREFLKSKDTKLGRDKEHCLRITTIFKAKGLEWDYVLLPGLIEGQSPDLREVVNVCVNKDDPTRTLSSTETLESERRLFYVALTRAKKGIYLFADPPENKLISRFIPEAAIDATVEAVRNLQKMINNANNCNSIISKIKLCAQKDEGLRDGILKMLRRLSTEGNLSESVAKSLSKATYEVNAVESAPFTYPHAYPDPCKSSPSPVPTPFIGLPF